MTLPRPLANAVCFSIWACLFFFRILVIFIMKISSDIPTKRLRRDNLR